MKPKSAKKAYKSGALSGLKLAPASRAAEPARSELHKLKEGFVCETDKRGHATPQGRSPLELVLDASEGFVPLWAPDTTLRWRFDEDSMQVFADPAAAKAAIRELFGEAVLAWGDAAPVKFSEKSDVWDFEIRMRSSNSCIPSGCTLASAFFPDGGRHKLNLYPVLFEQSVKEVIDTFTHEIGHTFGLRHFFANISETQWASEIFGEHDAFSIMNYGDLSELTDQDKDDLKRLYELAWSGELTNVNGTPIQFMTPYHTLAPALGGQARNILTALAT